MTLYCLYYKNATLTQQTFHLPLIHLYVTMLILMTVPFWCGWHCVGLLLKTFGSKWQRGRSLHSVAISSSCPGVTKQTGLASWHWSSSVLTLMSGIKSTAAERIIMTLLGGQWISKCWSLAARHSCSNSSALVATQTDWVQVTLFACKALWSIKNQQVVIQDGPESEIFWLFTCQKSRLWFAWYVWSCVMFDDTNLSVAAFLRRAGGISINYYNKSTSLKCH